MLITAKRVSGKRAQQLVDKGAMLIDMRSPVSFRDGTLPGAVNLSLRQLSLLVREPKARTLIFFGESESDDTLKAAINYAFQFGFTEVLSLGTKESWNK
jgi:rhodanese-related sulfurtransferase